MNKEVPFDTHTYLHRGQEVFVILKTWCALFFCYIRLKFFPFDLLIKKIKHWITIRLVSTLSSAMNVSQS